MDEHTKVGLAVVRARGCQSGQPRAMTLAKVWMAVMKGQNTNVYEVCWEMGISRQKLCRCVSPEEEIREGERILVLLDEP